MNQRIGVHINGNSKMFETYKKTLNIVNEDNFVAQTFGLHQCYTRFLSDRRLFKDCFL